MTVSATHPDSGTSVTFAISGDYFNTSLNTRTRIFICAPNEDSACAQSDQSLRCSHEETLQPWLSKMRSVKILIRLRRSGADLELHCPHMPEDTLSHGAAHLSLNYRKTFEINIGREIVKH